MHYRNLCVDFKIKYLFIEVFKFKIFFYVLGNNKADIKGHILRDENMTKTLSTKETIN